MFILLNWIYGTDLFDGKEFVIDGATQFMDNCGTSVRTPFLPTQSGSRQNPAMLRGAAALICRPGVVLP